MVYFYKSESDTGRSYTVVLGKDKFENDMLIKHGYKELNYVWFHADKYSSGHVYLKLKDDEKDLADVPRDVVSDCLQLCKANSIQGNKLSQCTMLVTPWINLRKNGDMKPGEVAFKSMRKIQKFQCYARDNKVLNRLEKTRVEVAENVELFLHGARKTKDPDFFDIYLANNTELLLAQEQERKAAKKAKKKA
ncbi:LAME_0F17722g1_1 [Lachancea meyersii CBS 8951]|uniref:LAME_0F17722g1_1 n=1 Tax=Lachancea meyersii CBS 8951 TaxID=1266667 RepID=A0A1G4K061_9SACH|nr:LAME_0F17722g1_1 [Lachancea meyersii CBS 8951]